jgi:hypothetical protein
MSKFIQMESYIKQISCTQDIVDCLIRRREESNKIRSLAGLKPIITYFLNYEHEKFEFTTLEQHFLQIDDISIYYNLQSVWENRSLKLKTTVCIYLILKFIINSISLKLFIWI